MRSRSGCCRAPAGGHNWHAMSFDPRRGVMYIPTQELPFFFSLPEEFVRTGVFKLNEVGMSFGVRVGGPRQHAVETAGPVPETAGRLKAFDPPHRRDALVHRQSDLEQRRRARHGRRRGVPGR